MIKALTKGERLALFLSVFFLIANGFFLKLLTQELTLPQGYTPAELKTLQESALSQIFQEIRMSIGDILWLKTDEYIHQGVIYRRMTPEEIMRETEKKLPERHGEHPPEAGEEEDFSLNKEMGYDEHHQEQVIPVIPHKERDFRGFLGDIERAIKPYSPTHVPHKDLKELIPWYRIMTLANPHHIRGYVVGAYFIYSYGKRPQEAVKFLEEGERNNPGSPEIKEALGRFWLYKFSQPERAIPYYKDAINLLEKKIKKTPLSEDEQELHRNAYVSLVMAYIKLKDLQKAEYYYEQVRQHYPNDRPVRDLWSNLQRLRRDLFPPP